MADAFSPNDADLQRLFRQAPEQAMEIIFREYYVDICRSVLRVIPDPVIAEDIAQEVFYELWRRREALAVDTSFGAYLRRAARNRSLNYLRDHKVVSEGADALPTLHSGWPDVEQRLALTELQQAIDQAVGQLPERCRLVFVLSRFEEMSYQEIADHLGISAKTVENQIAKALRLLRQALGPYLLWFVGLITFIYPQ